MAKSNENLIYGLRAIIETVRSGKDLEKVFIQKGVKGELMQELQQLVRDQHIPVSRVPVEKLNRLTRKNHQGAVAFVSPVKYYPLDQVIAQVFEAGKQPLFVMLDGLTDVRNFGSIARTAECMGADALIIPTQGSAQINADAVKTSAGALNYIPVCREPNLELTASHLRESGVKVVACTEKADKHFHELDLNAPVCLVMGAEDIGISPELQVASDEKGKISLRGKIASLNVGSACSMVLYECSRQRSK